MEIRLGNSALGKPEWAIQNRKMPQNNLSIPVPHFRTFITLALDEVAGQLHTLLLPQTTFLQTLIPSGRGGIDINI